MGTENVELVFRIRAEGAATLAQLRSILSGVNTEVGSGAKLVGSFSKANNELVVSLKSVAGAAEQASGGIKSSGDSISGSIVKATIYSEILSRLANIIKQATIDSALYAARTQQLNLVMDQLARVNGLSVPAVRAQADAIKGLNITTQESREVVGRMIFAQLDLTKATDLARLAQNAAKIAGISSSEALSGIINGIIEQRVQILRTYGIQVSFEQALIRGAAALHKTRETLTDYERANIALNEVLSKGPRIVGVYEISLSTAAGQMQSLQRYTDEAKNALGEQFLPVLQRVIGFLTIASKELSNNAEGWAEIARHVTAVGLALTVAKLVPGGPVVKLVAGGIALAGAEALTNVDAAAQAQENSTNVIERIQAAKREIAKKFQKASIEDKEQYIKEDARLSELQATEEKNLTETLAKIYKSRQTALSKEGKPGIIRQGLELATGGDLNLLSGYTNRVNDAKIPDVVKLGNGRTVTRQQIEAAIPLVGVTPPQDIAGLKFTPDPRQGLESQLGAFESRIKESTKTAEAGVNRARAGLLTGPEKIESERQGALARLNEEFKIFNATFKSTLEQAKSIKDPKEREALIKDVAGYQARFGAIQAKINQEFDLQQKKESRDEKIDAINRDKGVADARAQIQIDATKHEITRAQRLLGAQAKEPGDEEATIQKQYNLRISLSTKERDTARQKNQDDLDTARKVYDLTGDKKKLKDAENVFTIANLKAEGKFIEENSNTEVEKQIEILELRRKQRHEVELAFENAKRISDEERVINVSRQKDSTDRFIRLASAQALPGNERYVQELAYKARIQAAQTDFDITKESIEATRAAAYAAFALSKDKEKLERTSADLRVAELKNDYNLEKSIADARVEREIEIANIRRRQTEELRSSLGTLYDALVAKGRAGYKDFLDGYYAQFKKTIFVNIGEELFRGTQQQLGGIIKGQEKIDPITGRGTGELTTLGRVLRNTPLGVDPAKLAQDREVGSRDRNTKAVDRLTDTLSGSATAASGGVGAGVPGGSGGGGGFFSKLGGLFGIGNSVPLVIKNYGQPGASNFLSGGGTQANGGIDYSPDRGFGGAFAAIQRFVQPKKDPETGKEKFSAGATAIAAAAATPAILAGIKEGGVKGTLGATSAALSVAATIPGPQQPFILAGAVIAGLLPMLFGDPRQKKLDALQNRLNQKFELPASIDRFSDLAGNSLDYDFRGNLRQFRSDGSKPPININISAMDSKSFMDRGPDIAESVRNMVQLGHPLRSTIGEVSGAA